MTPRGRVSTVECCRRLGGIDEAALRSLLQSGRLPFVRKRGKLLIRVSDIDAYLDATRADRPPGVSDDD
jgi:excisionase family DNA binding protein